MEKLNALFTNLSWGIWMTVVIFNALGVTHIPWSVAIVPMVMSGVIMGFVLVGAISNKDKIQKAIEENEKKKAD